MWAEEPLSRLMEYEKVPFHWNTETQRSWQGMGSDRGQDTAWTDFWHTGSKGIK